MASPPPPPAHAETISGRARISDGDTLRIDGVRVRIWGIDAPESRQACEGRDGQTYECGRDATAVMREIIRGQDVTCERRDTDQYGRTVATCGTAAVPDLGEEMVRRGWAVEYRQFSRGRYSAAERQAREAGLGIWSGRFELPARWRREHRGER